MIHVVAKACAEKETLFDKEIRAIKGRPTDVPLNHGHRTSRAIPYTQLSLQLMRGKQQRGYLLLESHSIEMLPMWMKQVRVHPCLAAELGSIIYMVLSRHEKCKSEGVIHSSSAVSESCRDQASCSREIPV